jgi:hypothetical protein
MRFMFVLVDSAPFSVRPRIAHIPFPSLLPGSQLGLTPAPVPVSSCAGTTWTTRLNAFQVTLGSPQGVLGLPRLFRKTVNTLFRPLFHSFNFRIHPLPFPAAVVVRATTPSPP